MIIYVAGYQEVIDPFKSYKVWDKRVNPIAPVVTKLSGAEIIGLFKQKKASFEYGQTDYSKFD
jgi:hypothetical protein